MIQVLIYKNIDYGINHILYNCIREVYGVIQENNISVCCSRPFMTLMFYLRMLKNNYSIEILSRGNLSTDNEKEELVVGCVSALFYC